MYECRNINNFFYLKYIAIKTRVVHSRLFYEEWIYMGLFLNVLENETYFSSKRKLTFRLQCLKGSMSKTEPIYAPKEEKTALENLVSKEVKISSIQV